MLCWNFERVGLFFGEHDYGVVGEAEAGGCVLVSAEGQARQGISPPLLSD